MTENWRLEYNINVDEYPYHFAMNGDRPAGNPNWRCVKHFLSEEEVSSLNHFLSLKSSKYLWKKKRCIATLNDFIDKWEIWYKKK